MVSCLQVQPVETIGLPPDVQSQVGREPVPMFGDAALAAVDALGERLFLAVPAQAGLGQGRGIWVVLVEAIAAGTGSLAADHVHEQPRCPVAHAAREVLLPCAVIEVLAGDVGAVREQPVGQRPPCCPRSVPRFRPVRPVAMGCWVRYPDRRAGADGPTRQGPPARQIHQCEGAAHHYRPWPKANATHALST
jgi:hypothetical protein